MYRTHLFVNFRCHGVLSVCADLYYNILLFSLDLLRNVFASDKIWFSNYILIYLSNLPARVAHLWQVNRRTPLYSRRTILLLSSSHSAIMRLFTIIPTSTSSMCADFNTQRFTLKWDIVDNYCRHIWTRHLLPVFVETYDILSNFIYALMYNSFT